MESLENNYNNPKVFFKKFKAVKKYYKSQTPIVKIDNDDLLPNQQK